VKRTVKAVYTVTLLWALLGLASGIGAAAQNPVQSINEDVAVSFGFAGEVVANAWNPLRVTLRDTQSAELLLELDVGSLRRGPVSFRYTAPLTGGRGLYTFQDDVYLPAWRSFSWLVRTSDGIIASGTVPRYFADPKPLQLVLGPEAEAGKAFFAQGDRVVEITAADLPERAAAYSGVESVLLLPQTVPPPPAALVAAATTGSAVILGGEPGRAYEDVLALAPAGSQRLGAGTLNRIPELNRNSVQRTLRTHQRLAPDTLLTALTGGALTEAPTGQSATWLTLRVGAYAFVLLLLLRFGGGPGVLAALLLAGVLTLAAWRTRPAEPLLLRDRSVVLSGGALGLHTDLHYLFSFPGGAADVLYAAHPLSVAEIAEYQAGPENLTVNLPAYGSTLLAGKPRLEPAVLRWNGERVVNESENPLTDVFVTWGAQPAGLGRTDTGSAIGTVSRSGQQNGIGPGEALTVAAGSLTLPEFYADLAPLLPPGSVVARNGGTVYVLLPRAPAESDATR